MVFELVTGDLLFEPHAGETFTKEDGKPIIQQLNSLHLDHLAQIMELLGEFPYKLISSSRAQEFFNILGNLRYIPSAQLRFWPLPSVLKVCAFRNHVLNNIGKISHAPTRS